jgi:hypothetical protein
MLPSAKAGFPNRFQIQPNPAKPAQARAKFFQEKSLDFLGFSSAF